MSLRHLLKNLFKIKIDFACTLFSFEGSILRLSQDESAPWKLGDNGLNRSDLVKMQIKKVAVKIDATRSISGRHYNFVDRSSY